MKVQKNEDLSHKRLSSNEKWLQAYEEEFLKGMRIQIQFSRKEITNQPTLKQLIANKHHISVITDL